MHAAHLPNAVRLEIDPDGRHNTTRPFEKLKTASNPVVTCRGCQKVADNTSLSNEFVTVGRVGDVPAGKGRQVTVDGRWVALFNVNGTHHAIDAICLHQGGPLAEGVVSGCVVTCPWHGWQFDVTSGTFVQDPRVGVTRHEARVVGDEVQVRLLSDTPTRKGS